MFDIFFLKNIFDGKMFLTKKNFWDKISFASNNFFRAGNITYIINFWPKNSIRIFNHLSSQHQKSIHHGYFHMTGSYCSGGLNCNMAGTGGITHYISFIFLNPIYNVEKLATLHYVGLPDI